KTEAPMIGGMICPPCDATASTAPENLLLYPSFFINGIVNEPVIAALAAPFPVIVPTSALEPTEDRAGPPVLLPNTPKAKLVKNCPPPDFIKNDPKITNRINTVELTYIGSLNIPSVPLNIWSTIFSYLMPGCANAPGKCWPRRIYARKKTPIA